MNYIKNLQGYLDHNLVQVTLTLIIIALFFLVKSIIEKIVFRHAKKHEMAYSREVYVKKLITSVQVVLFLTIIGMIWEISLKGLSIYFASVFTIIGVGLFANWSILSNMTASVILFFFFPYRIGSTIKIIDGDNSVSGTVIDITLFYILIESEDKKKYSYPNNLAIQKAILQS
ncbi:MAG: mechanosensitive ion channel family protein [Cyclobacteriaceae bacterium]